MRINLAEIPDDGLSYVWSDQTKELNTVLADLIGKLPYQTEFFIKALNSKDYQISGVIRTEVPEVCSRCGVDFFLKIEEKFRGIIIPRQEDSRTGKYAKVNHVSEMGDGPEVLEYDGQMFDIGEHLHEVVAIAIPFNPACPADSVGNCSVCKVSVKDCSCTFGYDEVLPEEKPKNPFNALKNIKLN